MCRQYSHPGYHVRSLDGGSDDENGRETKTAHR